MTQTQRGGRFSISSRVGVALLVGVFLLALGVYLLYGLVTVPMPVTSTANLVSCLQAKQIPYIRRGGAVYIPYRYGRSARRVCY